MITLVLTVFILVFALTLLKCAIRALKPIKDIPIPTAQIPTAQSSPKSQNKALYRDIEYYQSKLDSLLELERLTELEYKAAATPKAESAALRKLITVDNQIYATQNKIDALRSELDTN